MNPFLLAFVLTATPSHDIGHFSLLKEGEVAKFSGVLFDENAVSHLITDKEMGAKEFDLKLQYELSKQENTSALVIETLRLDLTAQRKESDVLLEMKDIQIKKLSANYEVPMFIGGAVLGALIALGAVFVIHSIK